MTAPIEGWRFGRRGGVCGGCETAFEPGSAVTSCLYEDAEEGFSRRDWCTACFEEPGRCGEPFSWWASVVPEPEQKKAVFDLGVAREFLVRLLRENSPERASLRYLLALLLMRKRGVKVLEQFTDARGEVMSLTVPPDETVHEVLCPELDEQEAVSLREELGRLFDLGGDDQD